jgi:hypothetical protein
VKAAKTTTPDRVLATEASVKFEREVSAQIVTNYRKEFGIPSVAMPSAAELQASVEALQAQVDSQASRIADLLAKLRADYESHAGPLVGD